MGREGKGERAARAGKLEVARDGDRLVLLIDGIAYSSFEAEAPWSGWVWDALAAAVLHVRTRRPRVLLLGCGAGTVLGLLRRLRPEAELVAVELDPRVLAEGRRAFRLDDHGAEIRVEDGIGFLARTRRRFDLVIDDMFSPVEGGLARPVEDEQAHLERIAARLRPGGVAATNATTDDDPPGLARALRSAYLHAFPHVIALEPPEGMNRVLVGSRRRLDTDGLARGLEDVGTQDRLGLAALRVRRP